MYLLLFHVHANDFIHTTPHPAAATTTTIMTTTTKFFATATVNDHILHNYSMKFKCNVQ
jgi:hypothetical protein